MIDYNRLISELTDLYNNETINDEEYIFLLKIAISHNIEEYLIKSIRNYFRINK